MPVVHHLNSNSMKCRKKGNYIWHRWKNRPWRWNFPHKKLDGTERKEVLPILDHATAVDLLLKALIDEKIISSLEEIKGIGHRVVQGGKYFSCSAEFNQYTEDRVKELIPLAPLHNGAHLVAFHAFKNALPNVGNVAVFDTAFHQTMEPEDYLYPIPYEYYENMLFVAMVLMVLLINIYQ